MSGKRCATAQVHNKQPPAKSRAISQKKSGARGTRPRGPVALLAPSSNPTGASEGANARVPEAKTSTAARAARRFVEPVAPRLLLWFDEHGRRNLPWLHPRSAYRVWLSEVMLQQTQVATVIPYFRRFVEKYTNPAELARAPLDDVLALWSGLGYYSRARNLHRAAAMCVETHGGDLPRDFDALAALPGIGRSTAGAILAQAHGLRFPILDGNVKRVLARWRGVRGWPGGSAVAARLWSIAEQQTPHERVADYTQAIMDLGAGVCTRARPRCDACPLADDCVARRDNLTAELPQRKPARALPTRSTVMLVLRDASGRILLERRPPTGVWAGLWSLPEATDVAAAHREVARHADAGPAATHGKSGSRQPAGFLPLPSFVHGFSHFRLQVMPLQRHVSAASVVHDGDERRWLHLRDAQALGLPAPVRKLIASLEETPR